MKLTEIEFEDKAFKECVMALECENAEDIVELRCRKKGIESVIGVQYLVNLKLLDLTRNKLSEADLSNNTRLEEVYLGNNELSIVDVSGCASLTHLEVFINELETLDVSNNPLLEAIYANKNEIETLDVSKNNELLDLRLSYNELTDIDLTTNHKLERLDADKNPLTESTIASIEKLKIEKIHI